MVWSHITFKIMKILDHKERKIAPLCGLQCFTVSHYTWYLQNLFLTFLSRYREQVTCWLEYFHKLCPQSPKFISNYKFFKNYCRLATKLWSEIVLRVSTDPSSFAQKPSALKKYIIYIFIKTCFIFYCQRLIVDCFTKISVPKRINNNDGFLFTVNTDC